MVTHPLLTSKKPAGKLLCCCGALSVSAGTGGACAPFSAAHQLQVLPCLLQADGLWRCTL